jgi:hypothetical protein
MPVLRENGLDLDIFLKIRKIVKWYDLETTLKRFGRTHFAESGCIH